MSLPKKSSSPVNLKYPEVRSWQFLQFCSVAWYKPCALSFLSWVMCFLLPNQGHTQITGKITDQYGAPLSYASVYQENTTRGTVSNESGHYEFDPEHSGMITLVFQYVGYQKQVISIPYQGKPILQNVTLLEDTRFVEEIVISANREDPAYPVIRKAIEKRKLHKNWLPSYEADLYVKGLIKILKAPEAFLGTKIQDLGGVLDSLRQGIIYLSESQSKYYFMLPDKSKEVMISTKKSGTNSLFTANQFSMANINLYDNFSEMGRSVMSPIADAAFSEYTYKLLQLQVDVAGRTIYTIQVIPKSNVSPLMSGLLFIVGDSWHIHSADLAIAGASLKIPMVDTLRFKQVYLPLPTGEWALFNQTMFFQGSFFGFVVGGNFTYMFSNYNKDSDLNKIFETKEVFKVNSDALNQDSFYWAKNRPVPLTTEESIDYQKKDSLQVIWHSKSFQDSMDRRSNRFGLSDLFLGYTYSNRYKNYVIDYREPLSLVRFNVVEGWNIYLHPRYTKTDSLFRNWVVHPLIVYGFSDKTWKPSMKISRKFNHEMMGTMSLEFGKKYEQFDEKHPILLRSNTWSSVFYKQNYIRIFNKSFIKLHYEQEWVNSLFFESFIEWAKRNPLEKISDFSFFYKDRVYEENNPNNSITPDRIQSHDMARLFFRFTWSPGQTYSSYPNFRSRNPGPWPKLIVENIVGFPMTGKHQPFYTARIRIVDPVVNLNRFGYFSFNAEWAGSIINQPYYFMDFMHPLGNEWLIPDGNRSNMFNLLPFYESSTSKYYTAVHWKHHFNGFIMDKIPLLKKTSLKTMFTVNYLYNPEKKHFAEIGIGIENIIFGQIPMGSVEYFWSWSSLWPRDRGLIIKLTQAITN